MDESDLNIAIEQAQFAYDRARARLAEDRYRLAEHDANQPATYSYQWMAERYELLKSVIASLELTCQSRQALYLAKSARVQAIIQALK